MLTDEQIDRMEGLALREQVALSLGWTKGGDGLWTDQRAQFDYREPPEFDLGAAMRLILDAGRWVTVTAAFDNKAWIVEVIDMEEGDDDPLRVLASGPKSEAATVICRAYLKLKNRSDGR